MKFENSVVLITGAASGIGRAVAKRFASSNASLSLCDIDMEGLKTTEKIIREKSNITNNCIVKKVDVSKEMDVKECVNDTLSKFGSIDILVNCAGIVNVLPFPEITTEEWDQMIAVHLRGTFLFCKEVIEPMLQKGSGHIVNIGSTSGLTGGTSGAHYAAAKGGVIAFTRSIGKELANKGIRANAVVPSKIETSMLQINTPEERQALIEKIPLGRTGSPEEIADIVEFLASEKSSYIVGEIIVASGGY